MTLVRFEALPDSARLWCFGADRDLTEIESDQVRESMTGFVEAWTAHDQKLAASIEWTAGRFLFVAADEDVEQASGCSIDTLIRHLQGLEAELTVNLTDGRLVWFRRADASVQSVTRQDFKVLAATGEVGPTTPVFNLSLTSIGDVRDGRFERPASESWHSRYLPGGVRTG